MYPAGYISEMDFTYHKGVTSTVPKDVLYTQELSDENETCSNVAVNQCEPTNKHLPGEDISVLRYRAYYPKVFVPGNGGHNYATTPVPCVVIFHPVGFMECEDYIQPGMKTICKELARRGFIAITADYRGGRIKDGEKTSVQQALAPYRAMQDGRGAIRSIVKRQVLGETDFKINLDQFFVGGLSAGGIVAMGAAYYRNQAMINKVFPATAASASVEAALGHINEDYYYGENSSVDKDNPTYWPVIRGIMNCWGGISIPKINDGSMNPDEGVDEKAFFKAKGSEDADRINPPMIAFAGKLDTTIPFNDDGISQDFNFSTTTPFKKTNFCIAGNYIIKTPSIVTVKQCAAQNMYFVLKKLNPSGRFTELYVDCNMGHGLDKECGGCSTDTHVPPEKYANCEACVFNSDFSTGFQTPDQVYQYIVQRTAIFFQTIMNVPVNNAFPPYNYRGKSLFTTTVNNRICSQCDGITEICTDPNDDLCP